MVGVVIVLNIGRIFVKKFILFLIIICLMAGLAIGGWMVHAINSTSSAGPLSETKIVLIQRGTGVSGIGDVLAREGVISSALVFKIVNKIEQDPRPLKAGEYEFTPHITMRDALELLREGKTYDRKVTFAEGVTSWQVNEILKTLADMKGEITEVPAEGTLLPQTYHYIKDIERTDILRQMKEAMDKTLEELWNARAEGLPLTTKEEALTLASIVEKETGVASERARIAGVFINRLKKGMPLQTDPTVIYAMTKGEVQTEGQGPIGRRLLTADLQLDSPYNTYLYPGLPPGPIANPGRASIEATLHPEAHDYIYFVADGTGGHVFARTLAEHNSNVANWRKIRKSQ
jgi:UPF0755 protein